MQMLAVVASWMMMLNPLSAAARSTPVLSITASGATTIGLQIFANSNLNGSNPTGSISFRLYGPGDVSCTSVIFTSTVPVSGQSMNSAHYTTAAAGTYRWTSTYSGDANNNPVGPTACSDPNGAVIVQGANAGVVVSAPAESGGTIHGAATLTGGVNPTGTVSFFLSGPGDMFCNRTIFTSVVPVQGNRPYVSGNYTPTVTGTYRWRASYSGDGNNSGYPVTACLDQTDAVNVTQATADRGLFSYPLDGNNGVDTTRAFTWTTFGSAQAYYLAIGTAQYGTDLVNSGSLPATQSAFGVPALPTGRVLYATLLTETNGSWTRYQAITFTAAPGLATLTNPVNGQTNVSRTPVFMWSTIPGAQAYYLAVGTAMYGTDLVNSGALPPSQWNYSGMSLPAGQTLYATLLTETNGSWTRYETVTFSTS